MKSLPFLFALSVFSAPALAAPPAGVSPHQGMQMPSAAAPEAKLSQKGKVQSAINVPQYTYLEVTQNKKTRWLAVSTVAVKKGDVIRFDDGMEMTNFHSKSLNRTFPSVFFVQRVVVTKEKE
ncbi:MAG: hypothetical protein HY661_10580 [Betaproteobacteria bacterium]|nr:hypothetical protein [Betaproteobacteria bacterium]